jgi:hypothetical protein
VEKAMNVYRVFIHLGESDWGNDLMGLLADDYAAEHPDLRPLVVSVHEHAGWHLSYLYGAAGIADGTICDTANDAAVLSQAVLEFGKAITKVEIVGNIRRP